MRRRREIRSGCGHVGEGSGEGSARVLRGADEQGGGEKMRRCERRARVESCGGTCWGSGGGGDGDDDGGSGGMAGDTGENLYTQPFAKDFQPEIFSSGHSPSTIAPGLRLPLSYPSRLALIMFAFVPSLTTRLSTPNHSACTLSSCLPRFASRFSGVSLARQAPTTFLARFPSLLASPSTPLRPRAEEKTTRFTPTCFAEGDGDDDDDDDEEDGVEGWEVTLYENEKKTRSINVIVQHTIRHDGSVYVACEPYDDPITFARVVGNGNDGVVEPIEDDELVQKLFPIAKDQLDREHKYIYDTPFVLTMDDLMEGSEEGGSEEEEGDEDGDESEEILQCDDQEVEVRGEFQALGETFYVVSPLDPVVLVAREINEGVHYEVLSNDELESITPIIEEYIANADLR